MLYTDCFLVLCIDARNEWYASHADMHAAPRITVAQSSKLGMSCSPRSASTSGQAQYLCLTACSLLRYPHRSEAHLKDKGEVAGALPPHIQLLLRPRGAGAIVVIAVTGLCVNDLCLPH